MTFADLLAAFQRLDQLAFAVLQTPAFKAMHVTLPGPGSSELKFIRASAWMYCLYIEAGRVSIDFLIRQGLAFGSIDPDDAKDHINYVRCLRTESSHNLGFTDSDQASREAAQRWRRRACGTAVPNREADWDRCIDALCRDGHHFVDRLYDVVRRLEEQQAECQLQLTEWKRLLDRDYSVADFDRVVEATKNRFGSGMMNTVAFRNRHLDRWRERLRALEDGFDFSREAALLVERSLLDENGNLLPISGDDVMSFFDIGPGQTVGRILARARALYDENPCNGEQLLDKLDADTELDVILKRPGGS